MPKFPSITAKRLVRLLEREGFSLVRQSGSHAAYVRDGRSGPLVIVPRHNGNLKIGTLKSILRQAELSVDALISLL